MSAPGESLQLRDVRGPSALGGGWRRSLELLYLIASAEFRKSYLGTALGYLWSLARPLLVFAVLLVVFTKVLRIGSQVDHYAVLLLLNIVVFSFFQDATMGAVGSIVSNEGVVRKTQFPRIVIPLAVVLTALFNLLVNLVVVTGFLLASGVTPLLTWLLFPLVLLALLVLTTAVAMLVSSLYPRFRDTGIIWSVATTVLFYATPVLYPVEYVPAGLRTVMQYNPLAPLFEEMRRWVIDPTAPGPAAAAGGRIHVIAPVLIYLAICVLAVWVFNREAPRIAEEL
jgi:ABC-2 type transport system permease protein